MKVVEELRAEAERLMQRREDLTSQIHMIGELLVYYDPTAITDEPGMDVPVRIVDARQAVKAVRAVSVLDEMLYEAPRLRAEPEPEAVPEGDEPEAAMAGEKWPRVYTPERMALIRDNIKSYTNAKLVEMCNALPGRKIKSAKALAVHLVLVGLTRHKRKRYVTSPASSQKYTPERIQMIRRLFPVRGTLELWREVNKLPGVKIKSANALQMFANGRLGLHRSTLVKGKLVSRGIYRKQRGVNGSGAPNRDEV